MTIDTSFLAPLGIAIVLALVFIFAMLLEQTFAVVRAKSPDGWTFGEAARIAKDNVVFSVKMAAASVKTWVGGKARASARLVKLLGSLMFSVVILTLSLTGIALGYVAGIFMPLVEAFTGPLMVALEDSSDAWRDRVGAAVGPTIALMDRGTARIDAKAGK